jgi:hypothetical protein
MEDYLSAEESFAYALRRLELELNLLDRLFVVIRARGLKLHDERMIDSVKSIEDRILAARTELSRFNRQHQHVGVGPLVDVAPQAVASDLGDFGAELVDLALAEQAMFPKPIKLSPEAAEMLAHRQKLSGEFIDRRLCHGGEDR